jgi:hypothetical protein
MKAGTTRVAYPVPLPGSQPARHPRGETRLTDTRPQSASACISISLRRGVVSDLLCKRLPYAQLEPGLQSPAAGCRGPGTLLPLAHGLNAGGLAEAVVYHADVRRNTYRPDVRTSLTDKPRFQSRGRSFKVAAIGTRVPPPVPIAHCTHPRNGDTPCGTTPEPP